MNRNRRTLTLIVGLAVLLAAPVVAQDPAIWKGLDTWYTPAGGAQVTVNIPAGYFCNGTSPAQTRTISLKGKPIASVPSLAPSDTVIERPFDAFFDANDVATTNLRMVGLSLVGNGSMSVNCGTYTQLWNVKAGLSGAQGFGTITINRTDPAGGNFSASFPVSANLYFTNTANGRIRGPVNDTQAVTTVGACWTHAPGPNSVVVPGPISLDSDNNGTLDYTTQLGTGPNFWPGTCGPIQHTGPHPVTCEAPGSDCPEDPPNPCPEPWIDAELRGAVVKGVGFEFRDADQQPTDPEPMELLTDGRSDNKLVANPTISSSDLKLAIRDICVESIGALYFQ